MGGAPFAGPCHRSSQMVRTAWHECPLHNILQRVAPSAQWRSHAGRVTQAKGKGRRELADAGAPKSKEGKAGARDRKAPESCGHSAFPRGSWVALGRRGHLRLVLLRDGQPSCRPRAAISIVTCDPAPWLSACGDVSDTEERLCVGGWCGDCAVDIKGVLCQQPRTQRNVYAEPGVSSARAQRASPSTSQRWHSGLKLVSQLPGPSAAPSSQTRRLSPFRLRVLRTAAQGNLFSALPRLQQGRTPETLARCDTAACHTYCVLPLYEMSARGKSRDRNINGCPGLGEGRRLLTGTGFPSGVRKTC